MIKVCLLESLKDASYAQLQYSVLWPFKVIKNVDFGIKLPIESTFSGRWHCLVPFQRCTSRFWPKFGDISLDLGRQFYTIRKHNTFHNLLLPKFSNRF